MISLLDLFSQFLKEHLVTLKEEANLYHYFCRWASEKGIDEETIRAHEDLNEVITAMNKFNGCYFDKLTKSESYALLCCCVDDRVAWSPMFVGWINPKIELGKLSQPKDVLRFIKRQRKALDKLAPQLT